MTPRSTARVNHSLLEAHDFGPLRDRRRRRRRQRRAAARAARRAPGDARRALRPAARRLRRAAHDRLAGRSGQLLRVRSGRAAMPTCSRRSSTTGRTRRPRRSCASFARALRDDAALLVIERVLGDANVDRDGAFSDLNMLVMPGGRERTLAEFEALFASAGFRLRRRDAHAVRLERDRGRTGVGSSRGALRRGRRRRRPGRLDRRVSARAPPARACSCSTRRASRATSPAAAG